MVQELPDPITKAAWDNYVMMGMTMAKKVVGVDLIGGSERHINKYEYSRKNLLLQSPFPVNQLLNYRY